MQLDDVIAPAFENFFCGAAARRSWGDFVAKISQ
jgi:hypothetical protein